VRPSPPCLIGMAVTKRYRPDGRGMHGRPVPRHPCAALNCQAGRSSLRPTRRAIGFHTRPPRATPRAVSRCASLTYL